MSEVSGDQIQEFKERWYQGNLDAEKILKKLIREGVVLDSEFQDILKAIAAHSRNVTAFGKEINQIKGYLQSESYSEAMELIERCIEQEPHYYQFTMIKGIILMESGRVDEAFAHLDQAYHWAPYACETSYNLACYHAAKENRSHAENFLRAAVRIAAERTGTDYRPKIAKEPWFQNYLKDEKFRDEFTIIPLDGELGKLLNPYLESSGSIEELDPEDWVEILSELDEVLEEEEDYDAIEVKSYFLGFIVEDLEEHGEAHEEIYEDYGEGTPEFFQSELRTCRELMLKLEKPDGPSVLQRLLGESYKSPESLAG